jgi:hypothetical protein
MSDNLLIVSHKTKTVEISKFDEKKTNQYVEDMYLNPNEIFIEKGDINKYPDYKIVHVINR